MLKFKTYWVLPALIAIGLSFPMGVSNKFLPNALVSSIFDEQLVYIPVISLQTFLLFIYCVFNIKYIKFTLSQLLLTISLSFFSLACSIFSVNSSGFLSYSTIWFFSPFVILVHYKKMEFKNLEPLSYTLSMIAYFFLPFYAIDLVISGYLLGFNDFTSFMLASNGHTFISMLLILFIQMDILSGRKKYYFNSYETFALLVYALGGLISQGRMALGAMILASIFLHRKKAKKLLLVVFLVIVLLVYLVEKFRTIFDVIFSMNFEDPVAWSSMISRLKFWDIFIDIFYEYPLAGSGGLFANAIKYDYGFPFNVFVDPHNEFIFILSGFGLAGFIFIFSSIVLVRSFIYRQLISLKSNKSFGERESAFVLLVFIILCSMTNANSAKQNIEMIVCLSILFSVSSLIGLKYYGTSPTN
jgi:hypothetical protein